MGYDDRREIFERLEAIERRLGAPGRGRGAWDEGRGGDRHGGGRRHRRHDRDRHDDGGDFEEKRIIDTIVRLVGEHVGELLAEQGRAQRRDGGDEKRIIDQIVACVSEHVQEIVRAELDRRLGPAALPAGEPPPDGGSESESS